VKLPSTCTLVLLIVASAAPGRAADDADREAAGAHYTRGIDLATQGLYEAALEQFNQAYAKSPHFAVLYNIGQAQIALGRPLEAIEALSKYLREGADKVPLSRREQVQAQIALLESKLAELTVTTDRPGALVSIDGRDVGKTPLYQPIRAAAGTHTVSITMEGVPVLRQIVTLREGDRQALAFVVPVGFAPAPIVAQPPPAPTVVTTPPPAAPPRDLRRWAYVSAATGAAVGAVALGVYLWKRDQYEDWRAANSSLQQLVPGSAAYHEVAAANNGRADSLTTANHTIIGLSIASAVLIAGGATLYLLDRQHGRGEADPSVRAAGSVWSSFAIAVGPDWSPRLAWSASW
jgi:tetratricopeptide (TPR) repeat protein